MSDNDTIQPINNPTEPAESKSELSSQAELVVNQSDEGFEQLIEACKTSNLTLFQLLVEKGANLNGKDKNEKSVLSFASETGQNEIVEFLLKQKHIELDTRDKMGSTSLSRACSNGHTQIVKMLLEYGSNANNSDRMSWTPLTRACEKGYKEIVQHLVEHKADLNFADKYGVTPLSRACSNGYVDVVKYLIEQGANINKRDNYGESPLSRSLLSKRFEVAVLLIYQGAFVNNKSNNKLTPLSLACSAGNWQVAELLLARGADLNCQDVSGKTPFSICLDRSCSQLEELLRKYLIDEFYRIFQQFSVESLREKVLESIDNEQVSILKNDYLKAFELINLEALSEDLALLNDKEKLEYFLGFEFQERFIEDIINNLKSQIELLEIGKIKLQLSYPELQSNESNEQSFQIPSESYRYKDLARLIPNNSLIELISALKDDRTKIKKAFYFLNLIEVYQKKLKSKIDWADSLYKLISDKCTFLLSKKNDLKLSNLTIL